jgi:hypothetical protein
LNEDLLAILDMIVLQTVEEELGGPDPLGPENAPGALEPALFDHGGHGLIDVRLFNRIATRIGPIPFK